MRKRRFSQRLIIIKQENPKDCGVGTCANCGEQRPVRPVEEMGWIARESRGWHQICFDCFGPHVFWQLGEAGKRYMSPISQF